MTPLIKWTGGKRSEIPFIKPHYPSFTKVQRVIEPFAGGAAVAWEFEAPATVLNDVNQGLVEFYRTLQDNSKRDAFVQALLVINAVRANIRQAMNGVQANDLVNIYKDPTAFAKATIHGAIAVHPHPFDAEKLENLALKHARSKLLKRIPKIEADRKTPFTFEERIEHLETALQSAWYEAQREVYNGKLDLEPTTEGQGWKVASWWTVRTLCYSGMFRYAANGDFNVPYGGIGYNARDFSSSIAEFNDPKRLDFLKRTTMESMDFEMLFEKYKHFNSNDFVFVDPPYDSAFSKYNHEGDFTRGDQERLRDTLLKCNAPWMQVIKTTDFIEALYTRPGIHLHRFDKKYGVNFRNRHDRGVEHLVITNYPLNLDLPND